jgi:diacylglycerol kinase (ATP)
LVHAVINSANGLKAIIRSETAFRQELVLLILAVPLACLVTAEGWKRLALIVAVLQILIVEVLNTCIEKVLDRISLRPDSQIGRIKDMGSAAVGIAILIAITIWAFAIAERLHLFL